MEEGTREFLRRRVAPFLLLVAAFAVYAMLKPSLPHDQIVHLVLGDPAPRVTELTVRYGAPRGSAEGGRARDVDWAREVTFSYLAPPAGAGAPRIVTHDPRLPDGNYLVEVEVATRNDRAFFEREGTLGGGTASIDVSQAVP